MAPINEAQIERISTIQASPHERLTILLKAAKCVPCTGRGRRHSDGTDYQCSVCNGTGMQPDIGLPELLAMVAKVFGEPVKAPKAFGAVDEARPLPRGPKPKRRE